MTFRPGRNAFQWRSLKARLTLGVLLVFTVSIWLLAFYASRTLRGDLQVLLGEQQYAMVSVVAAEVNQEMEDRLNTLELLAQGVGRIGVGNRAALQEVLQSRPVLLRMFNGGVRILGPDARINAAVPRPIASLSTSYMDRDFMVTVFKDGKATVSGPVMGRERKAPVFYMLVPVHDLQGHVVGAVAGLTDLSRQNFLDKIIGVQYGKTGGYVLAAPQQRLIVTATDKRRIMEAMRPAGQSVLADDFSRGIEGYDVTRNAFGVEVLASIKGIPAAGWSLTAALPATEAFEPIHSLQQRMLLAAVVITVLSGMVVWWLLARQLSPLQDSARALAALPFGDQYPRPLPVVRQDEIGDLVGGFNLLLDRLGKREAALRASEAELNFLVSYTPVTLYRCAATPPFGATYVSPNIAEIMGYTPEQFTSSGSFWADNIHPDDRQRVFGHLPQVMKSGSIRHEYRFRAGDGSYRWMHDELRLVRDASGGPGEMIGYWVDVSDRKHAEELLRQRGEELKDAYRQLSEAQEQERRALARELHDQVGQNLGALGLNLNSVEVAVERCLADGERKRFRDSLLLAKEVMQRVRDITLYLRPPMLDDFGLFSTLRWWVHESEKRSGISIKLDGAESIPRLPLDVESTLFRIAQEALLNAISHSGATQISVSLDVLPGSVRLGVCDNGRGLVADVDQEDPARIPQGIRIMRERAEGLRGRFSIESWVGEGTRVVVEVPRKLS